MQALNFTKKHGKYAPVKTNQIKQLRKLAECNQYNA